MPAQTYNKLFALLADDFEIGFLERHGYKAKFTVTDGWRFLKEELLTEIEDHYAEKIVGIGHSLGGILHFPNAVEKPELYRQVILLESPLMSRLSEFGFRLLQQTGRRNKTPLIRQTDARRRFWNSKEEVFEHFKQKQKFAAFDDEVLRDYVEHGTTETADGVKLFFDPAIESGIYQTLAYGFSKYRKRLKVSDRIHRRNAFTRSQSRAARFYAEKFPDRISFYRRHASFPVRKTERNRRAYQKNNSMILLLGNKEIMNH